MPKLAEDFQNNRYYSYYDHVTGPVSTGKVVYRPRKSSSEYVRHIEPPKKYVHTSGKVYSRKSKGKKFIQKIISASVLTLLSMSILLPAFSKVTMSFWRPSKYPHIKTDYSMVLNPTINYLSNNWYLGNHLITGANEKSPLMENIKEGVELSGLENQLVNLMSSYPSVHAGIYVFDPDSGDYAGVNADESFATASIIKLPILVQLFRSIELGQVSLNESMPLTEYYRTEGSGDLQFKAENSTYTIDELARRMITDSDNSATNMIMARLGSMTDVNSGIKDWGLSDTFVKTWLPDLSGTNRTTPKDMATILYNLNNSKFLSESSREKIFDYMGHVKNTRLLKAGLPPNATLIHKTGDIGKMLGDAGIVYSPNGKKYIVVILANRPHNSPQGKDFIVNASSVIYNVMTK